MKRAIALVTLILAILILPVIPVLAIAEPDSAPSINAVYVYENVSTEGDSGVLVDYYLDYAAVPTETASEAFLVVFVDTDGETQLKAVAPYTYQDNGYGRGLVWMRFTPDEVTAYGLDSVNQADYEIWLVGNPTLTWTPGPDPPKTTATIDQWATVGDPSSLIALRVLYYADVLELIWTLDLITETAMGSSLSALGEGYFMNVIDNLRTIAPDCFSSVETDPVYNPLDYDTAFGATATSGTADVTGSPYTIVEGGDTITVGGTIPGTIIIDLAGWTSGTITDDTGTVTGSPVDLMPGTNTLTVTGAGDFTVDVAEVTTITLMETSVTGTGFDLTALATTFGMSRWFFSGLIWMLVTLLVCAAVYRAEAKSGGSLGGESGGGKSIMAVFSLMVVGGALLGLLSPLIAALLFIACGVFIGYILFFKSETLHKGFMFMLWMFVIVSFAGNYVAGSSAIVATRLTAGITANETGTISVASTDGFGDSGVIVIGDEHIGYPSKTDTTFDRTGVLGVTVNPIVRAMNDTEAVEHQENAMVRTREAAILNSSMDYKIAKIADTAGVMGFITFPKDLLDLILSVFTLPLGFLGSDLAVLSYIWIVVAAGMIVGFVLQLAGGRRV